jgi:hypothetical protein
MLDEIELRTTETALAESSSDASSDSQEYEVEAVRGHKVEDGVVKYYLKWKGYGEEDNTWESESKLECHDILAKYIRGIEKGFETAPATVKFIGAIAHEDGLMYHIQLPDGSKREISGREAKANWPVELIDFLESAYKIITMH